ncbi:MAG TPA: hypothetical protein VII23_00820 [Terriglobales bacterium]
MPIDPAAGLALFNAIATAGKNIYEIAQGVSKIEVKQQLMEVYDTLMNLKVQVSELEDENRNLRDNLRFKGDEFVFNMPFWYEKKFPDRALCPKCFSQKVLAPMGPVTAAEGDRYRDCLVCGAVFNVSRSRISGNEFPGGGSAGWTSY